MSQQQGQQLATLSPQQLQVRARAALARARSRRGPRLARARVGSRETKRTSRGPDVGAAIRARARLRSSSSVHRARLADAPSLPSPLPVAPRPSSHPRA